MPRYRRALVRGEPARYWDYADGHLHLRHPEGVEETEIPVAHLTSDWHMEDHYARLRTKTWVTTAAIDELREIAAGARP